jgi:cytochrome c peroxidase
VLRPPLFLQVVLVLIAAVAVAASARGQGLPPPKFPPENPFSEQKRVLGKLLFFEEQLSSDSTMACGTCHVMGAAGADPRKGRHPGPDGILNTLDDKLASHGVVRSDVAFDYQADPVFGFEPQVTLRAANAVPMAAFAPELFWDGAVGTEFVDPETGLVAIAAGGALESQAVRPPLSPLEMGHAGRDWPAVTAKLAAARPMALATDLPPDMAQVLASQPTYPDLFLSAFGTQEISARRIAFALATYERTLVPDRTPWDRFTAGSRLAYRDSSSERLNCAS